MAGTIAKTYTEMLKKYFGSAELMIYPDQNSPANFVTDSKLAPFQVAGIEERNNQMNAQMFAIMDAFS